MRLFVAVGVPAEIKARLGALSEHLSEIGARAVAIDKIHITLAFMGHAEPRTVPKITAALNSIEAKPFECGIGGIGSFGEGSPRVIFAKVSKGSDHINRIHRELTTSLKHEGIGVDDKEESIPHLTLARAAARTDRELITRFIRENTDLQIGTFVCSEIKLKSSVNSVNGYVYEDIASKRFS
jgi:2'-5' RNA ligase